MYQFVWQSVCIALAVVLVLLFLVYCLNRKKGPAGRILLIAAGILVLAAAIIIIVLTIKFGSNHSPHEPEPVPAGVSTDSDPIPNEIRKVLHESGTFFDVEAKEYYGIKDYPNLDIYRIIRKM